jgi:hypothetical protein
MTFWFTAHFCKDDQAEASACHERRLTTLQADGPLLNRGVSQRDGRTTINRGCVVYQSVKASVRAPRNIW